MTCDCPQHGFQLCCLVSPDLLEPESGGNPSDLVLVTLYSHYKFGKKRECTITMSKEFANKYALVSSDLDFSAVFQESDWYSELGSLCWGCYCQRWPELVPQVDCRS